MSTYIRTLTKRSLYTVVRWISLEDKQSLQILCAKESSHSAVHMIWVTWDFQVRSVRAVAMVAFCGINFLLGPRRFGLYFFLCPQGLHCTPTSMSPLKLFLLLQCIKDRCTHSELALLGLHLKSCFHQLLKYHIQMLQMFLLCITEHYQIIKVGTWKSSQPSLRHLNYVPTYINITAVYPMSTSLP